MADEKKTATIKLYRDNVPRITITYKNKKDLFKQFQKKISKLNLCVYDIYWTDWDNDSFMVKTADDLIIAVENCPLRVRVRSNSDRYGIVSCPSSDEEEEERMEKAEEKKEKRNCSPSPARGRGRSRPKPRHRCDSQQEPYYDHMPWFGAWNPIPFYCDQHAYGKGRQGRSEKKAYHCCCRDICKEF